jgi:RNA polymerase sigma factor (TIGR02999 family)
MQALVVQTARQSTRSMFQWGWAGADMQAHETNAATLLAAPEARALETRGRLFSELYHELHRMAQHQLRNGGSAVLSPTTLLHETFLNLSRREADFANRAQFMSYAARAMRGLIIDYLRSQRAQKRGSGFELTLLPTEPGVAAVADLQSDTLSEALDELAHIDSRLAECVDLRFFCGFSFEEIAGLWQVSVRTVQRDWDKARFLLSNLMEETATPSLNARTS